MSVDWLTLQYEFTLKIKSTGFTVNQVESCSIKAQLH